MLRQFAFIAVLFTSLTTLSQSDHSTDFAQIFGFVKASGTGLLLQATVLILDKDGERELALTDTNSEGRYSALIIPGEERTLKVELEGYRTFEHIVMLEKGERKEMDILLTLDDSGQ